jgi:hypothetical protein
LPDGRARGNAATGVGSRLEAWARLVWGRWLMVPAAVVMVGVAVALPAPRRPTAVPGPGVSARSGAATPGGADLPGLASTWPEARPLALPVPSDGSAFVPRLVLSDADTVAVAIGPDGGEAALVAVSADGRTKVLQAAAGGLFQGVVLAAGRLYWTATPPGGDRAGPPHGPTELRSVPLAGGPVRVRTVPGVWTMSRWPWLVTTPDVGAWT